MLAESKAELEAIANATQYVDAQALTQQVKAQSTQSTEHSKKPKELRFGPRPYRFSRTGLSKKTLSMRTTEGGLTLTRAKGLSAQAIRSSSATERSDSATMPKKRSATGNTLP